jgi:hypothetical protein
MGLGFVQQEAMSNKVLQHMHFVHNILHKQFWKENYTYIFIKRIYIQFYNLKPSIQWGNNFVYLLGHQCLVTVYDEIHHNILLYMSLI